MSIHSEWILCGNCYHVGEEMGTDSNRPFKTIQQAVDLVGAGGKVWINGKNGRTYYERVLVRQKFGTSTDRILISGDGLPKPVIDGRASDPNGEPNLPIGYGSPYNALLWIDNCKHVTVENIKVQYSRRTGISVTRNDVPPNNPDVAVEDVIVKNCDVEETAEFGIAAVGLSSTITDIHIEKNVLNAVCTAGGQGEAIRVSDGYIVRVSQNKIINKYKEGINLVKANEDVHVFNNFIKDDNQLGYDCRLRSFLCFNAVYFL